MEAVSKTQTIRLIDVFFIGPLMIYAGTREKSDFLKYSLIITGALTILYNGKNYKIQQARL